MARIARCASGLRQCDAALALVLPAAVLVRGLADLVRFEEQHLRDAFVRIDLRGQRRGVGELERDVAFPLGFQRRYVHYYAATCVRRIVDDEIVGDEVVQRRHGDVVDFLEPGGLDAFDLIPYRSIDERTDLRVAGHEGNPCRADIGMD